MKSVFHQLSKMPSPYMKEMNRGFSARIQGEWRERSLDNGGKRVYSAKHGPRLDPRSLVDVVPKQGASVSVLESSHAFQPQPTVSRDEVTKEGYIDPANNTIDYALMFVPVEGVFQFIVENELELKTKNVDIYDEAMEKKVILVPPSLLLVYLSTIRSAVDTFNLQDQAKDLIELHKKFMVQWEKYHSSVDQVGASIESLQKKYKDFAA